MKPLFKRFLITTISFFLLAVLQTYGLAQVDNTCNVILDDGSESISIFNIDPEGDTIRYTYIIFNNMTDANIADFELELDGNSWNYPIDPNIPTTIPGKSILIDKHPTFDPNIYIQILHNPIISSPETWKLNVNIDQNYIPFTFQMLIRSRNPAGYLTGINEIICISSPTLASIGSQNVDEGDCLIIQLAASGSSPLVFDANGPAMDDFCWLIDYYDGTGVIVCCPSYADFGIYDITVEVTMEVPNGFYQELSDSETFTLTVGDCHAPVLQNIGPQSVEVGANLVIPLLATDADAGDSLSFSVWSVPPTNFCSLIDNTNGTGIIFCDPNSGNTGTYTITVTVTDDCNQPQSDSEVFTLLVWANQSPILEYIGPQSVEADANIDIHLLATDADLGDLLSFSVEGLPTSFCSLIDNYNGTGSINCTPSSEDIGTYIITVTVTDNGGPPQSDSETFALTVGECHAPVLLSIGPQSVEADANIDIPLSAMDADGDTLIFSVGSSLPPFCFLDPNTVGIGGHITDQIICNPNSGDIGIYNITVMVTDDCELPQSDSETFTLKVWENEPPILGYIGPQVMEPDANIDIPLSATDDPNENEVLSFSIEDLPMFCWLDANTVIIGNQTTTQISCDPNSGDIGTYIITVTVTDNGEYPKSDSETFALTVESKAVSTACRPCCWCFCYPCCCWRCCWWWCYPYHYNYYPYYYDFTYYNYSLDLFRINPQTYYFQILGVYNNIGNSGLNWYQSLGMGNNASVNSISYGNTLYGNTTSYSDLYRAKGTVSSGYPYNGNSYLGWSQNLGVGNNASNNALVNSISYGNTSYGNTTSYSDLYRAKGTVSSGYPYNGNSYLGWSQNLGVGNNVSVNSISYGNTSWGLAGEAPNQWINRFKGYKLDRQSISSYIWGGEDK